MSYVHVLSIFTYLIKIPGFMKFKNLISKQLCKPKGLLGWYVGKWMNALNKEMYQMIYEHLNFKDAHQILEIGIGNGLFLRNISSKHPNIQFSGIDISKTMIRHAKRMNKRFIQINRVIIKYGNANSIPFPNDSFDSIYSANTIYFWTDPEQILKEVSRVLKPNGQFLLAFNTQEDMTQNNYNANFFTFYTKEKAENLLFENGFEIIENYYERFSKEDSLLLIAVCK